MSEENAPKGEAAPAVQTEIEKPRVQVEALPPEALKQRLEREAEKGRKDGVASWLAANGFADESAAKAALAELAAKREAQKTAEERLAALAEQHKSITSRATLAETVLAERCDRELEKLTDEQRAAVQKIAGEDKVAVLRTIDALSSTWAQANPPPDTKQKPTAPKADTAPGRTAPKEPVTSEPDHKAIWEDMQRTNPFKAGQYLRQHRSSIFPSQ